MPDILISWNLVVSSTLPGKDKHPSSLKIWGSYPAVNLQLTKFKSKDFPNLIIAISFAIPICGAARPIPPRPNFAAIFNSFSSVNKIRKIFRFKFS